MAASQDTEITLGTGKMVAIFFGLVALCAVCFGAGYSMGRNSVSGPGPRPSTVASSANGVRPSAGSPDDANSKAQKNGALPSHQAAQGKRSADAPDNSSPPPLTGYYVQVAAVSKQEDAEALVAA
ncbi:MAG: hypothetical protein JOY93_02100, partial [Acidobacteriales bacterium]|nr:hypothetical protein [Terriglobales bacterium]